MVAEVARKNRHRKIAK